MVPPPAAEASVPALAPPPSARHDGQADQQDDVQALQNALVAQTRESRRLSAQNQRLQEDVERMREDPEAELGKIFWQQKLRGITHIIIPDTSFLVDLDDESARA